MPFIINLLITMLAYMAYPIFKFKILNNNKTFTKEEISKICIINSIVMAIVFMIIGVSIGKNYTPNFTPAFFWYCINISIFKSSKNDKKSIKIKENNSKRDDENVENSKYILIIGIAILSFVLIIALITMLATICEMEF